MTSLPTLRLLNRSQFSFHTTVRSYVSTINVKDLEIHRTTSPKAKTPKEELQFGKTFTDHMLEVDWHEKKGWGKPRIVPYGNLNISPAATGLHYGIQ
eukprot:gene18127-21078_t